MIYHQALICQNGHCISACVDMYPESQQNFCTKCGEKTISVCPSCHAEIRGRYNATSHVCLEEYKVPPYCHNCGKAYPWTLAALESANELIMESDGFSDNEKQKLMESLPNLMIETPKTQLSLTRLKKALIVMDQLTAEAIRNLALVYGCDIIKQELKKPTAIAETCLK